MLQGFPRNPYRTLTCHSLLIPSSTIILIVVVVVVVVAAVVVVVGGGGGGDINGRNTAKLKLILTINTDTTSSRRALFAHLPPRRLFAQELLSLPSKLSLKGLRDSRLQTYIYIYMCVCVCLCRYVCVCACI